MAKYRQLLVTEREMIERLSKITGYGKDIVRDVIKAQSDFIIDELKNGIPVRLCKLGEFSTIRRRCQGGYDFSTKEVRPPSDVTIVKFNISKRLKNEVHDSENSY